MSPFIRLARCAFCGDENEHVQAEVAPDGGVRWLCRGDSTVIVACAKRRFGPFDAPDHVYSTEGPRADTHSDAPPPTQAGK